MAEADGLHDNTLPIATGVHPMTANITMAHDTEPPAGEPRHTTVGQQLRAAREAAGIDLKQLSVMTRVTQRHLEAIEAGDYATLPGRPYALGFSRSYARALGMDDKPITEAVRRELDARDPAPPPRVLHQFEVGDPAKTPSRMAIWLALGMVVAIAGAGLMFWRSYYMPSAELPALVGPEEQASAAPPPVAVQTPAPVPTGPVVFTALEDRIWVRFYDGMGKPLLQKELVKGESYTVPGDVQDVRLWTGRPDALAITIGGQPVPRIAEKEGIVKDVAVSAAALMGRGTSMPAAQAPSLAPSPTSDLRQSAPTTASSGPA